MCVIALAWHAHPDWRLVVAANRDEAHDRPTADLNEWPGSDIIAGRDLRSGGSWLGVNGHKPRFAGVTNVADQGKRDPNAPSRGRLVQHFLEDGGGPEADARRMNPFNLILANEREAVFVTNRPNLICQVLQPGVHGTSNGAKPADRERTGRLKEAMAQLLGGEPKTTEELLDQLMDALDDREPNQPADRGSAASSRLFVQDPIYGTRCSTAIAVDGPGRGRIRERRFNADGERTGETERVFTWPA